VKKLLIILFTVVLFSGCGNPTEEIQITTQENATSLTYEQSEIDSALSELLDAATFYVKAKADNVRDIGNSSMEFVFILEEDFSGNLETDEENKLCVVGNADDYVIGETYYLMLDAAVTPKYRSIGVILYSAVETEQVVMEQDGSVSVYSDMGDGQDRAPMQAGSVDTFESALRQYVSDHEERIAEKTAEALPDTSAGTLENAMSEADAIWLITIQDGYEVNAYFSICDYSVDKVLKGDNSYLDQTFSDTIPTQLYETNGQYLLLLCEVEHESYTELEVVFDDYWLLPVNTPDAQTVMEAYA
jgi:hypothetical protein